MEHTRVCIKAADLVAGSGLAAILARRPGLTVTDVASCDVLILLADTVDDALLEVMRDAYRSRAGGISCVIIAYEISEPQLSTAADLGLIGLLQRASAAPERVCDVVGLCRSLRPVLPSSVLEALHDEFRRTQRVGAMSEREAEVLSLYADGLTAADVGRRLDLSVRTIRKIEQEVVTRLNLRNRTHAVAFAMRAGVVTPRPAAARRTGPRVRSL